MIVYLLSDLLKVFSNHLLNVLSINEASGFIWIPLSMSTSCAQWKNSAWLLYKKLEAMKLQIYQKIKSISSNYHIKY